MEKYKPQIFKKIIYSAFTLIMFSCAHKNPKDTLSTSEPSYKHSYDFSDAEKLTGVLQKIPSLSKQPSRSELVEILKAYYGISRMLKQDEITLSAQSKTTIKIGSFCVDSEMATPEENEVFLWIKEQPKITLLKELLTLFRNQPLLNRSSVQEIIWNLENKTPFEDYPKNLQKVLLEVSPKSAVILPSRAKRKILEEILPSEIIENKRIVEGQYRTFEDFESSLLKKSTLKLSNITSYSKIPDTNIQASSTSNGYTDQTISFYNQDNKVAKLDIRKYTLKPYRTDVQPIVLASIFPYSKKVDALLKEKALSLLSYIGAQYPMNSQEKKLVEENPIEAAIALYDALIAEENAHKLVPELKGNDGSDALRHFIWSGLLVRDLGEETARKFLNAHESTPGQPIDEKNMDQFNNERGIEAAIKLLKESHFEDHTFFEVGVEALKAGRLKVLK
jgi:hypothetical protein